MSKEAKSNETCNTQRSTCTVAAGSAGTASAHHGSPGAEFASTRAALSQLCPGSGQRTYPHCSSQTTRVYENATRSEVDAGGRGTILHDAAASFLLVRHDAALSTCLDLRH